MKNHKNKNAALVAFLCLTFLAGAQPAADPEMADTMRQDGKIYVVIGVLAIIFAAIILFLIYLERKVKKLEDRQNKK